MDLKIRTEVVGQRFWFTITGVKAHCVLIHDVIKPNELKFWLVMCLNVFNEVRMNL